MLRQALYFLLYPSMGTTQSPQTIVAATCPTAAPGPSSSLPGWDMSGFLYTVYSESGPDGSLTATAHLEFDIVGAFSNQLFHCETTGADILANHTRSGGEWKSCTAKEANTTSGYATSFRYNPGDWYTLTLREMSLCGTDPQDVNTVLFKGVATNNFFVSNRGAPPTPPHGGTNVETWTTMYYSSAHVQGEFSLIPPNHSTNCTPDALAPEWEVEAFGLAGPCLNCTANPWIPTTPGFQVSFGLHNVVNNYDVGCSFFYTLSNTPAQGWTYCGVNPEDAPLLPATWVYLDWDTHMLQINQTWQCRAQDNAANNSLVLYTGHASLFVPWECETPVQCSAELPPSVSVTGVFDH